MELDELLEKPPEFELSTMPGVKHRLRPPSLQDMLVFKNKYGENGVQKACLEMDWKVISEVIVRLLEDKSPFAMTEEEEYDDEGVLVKRNVFATEKLLKCIVTLDDQAAAINSIGAAFTAANPKLKTKIIAEVKKKMAETSPGTKSSTDSQPNMDGQPSTSSRARRGKSSGGSKP